MWWTVWHQQLLSKRKKRRIHTNDVHIREQKLDCVGSGLWQTFSQPPSSVQIWDLWAVSYIWQRPEREHEKTIKDTVHNVSCWLPSYTGVKQTRDKKSQCLFCFKVRHTNGDLVRFSTREPLLRGILYLINALQQQPCFTHIQRGMYRFNTGISWYAWGGLASVYQHHKVSQGSIRQFWWPMLNYSI